MRNDRRRRGRWLVALTLLAVSTAAWAGREWVENDNVDGQGQDAGSTPPGAQTTSGDGPLEFIRGRLSDVDEPANLVDDEPIEDLEDTYLICIFDPEAFRASTIDGGGFSEFDSRLYLFDLNDLGLLGNIEAGPSPVPPFTGAVIESPATDGTGSFIPAPGLYYLVVGSAPRLPSSTAGDIFDFQIPMEISGPDGVGGAEGFCDWNPGGPPVGACCAGKFGCIPAVTFIECVKSLYGKWLGPGSTCDDDPCAEPLGACCIEGVGLGSGNCMSDVTQDFCENSFGGTWYEDSSCDVCPEEPIGACCYSDGKEDFCDETTESDCEQFYEGSWLGPDTSCPCFAATAPGGATSRAAPPTPVELEAGETVFVEPVGPVQGAGYRVALQGCCFAQLGPFGPCVLPDGTCFLAVEDACMMAGGRFLGPGFTCQTPIPPPGWTNADNRITLTGNEPAFWSALTGQPKGVSPFGIVDQSPDPVAMPGLPADDGTTDRVLRGFIYAWASDAQDRQIAWNHLKGDATIVNYRDGAAWEYNAWAFQAAGDQPLGQVIGGVGGQLNLDGADYVPAYDLLLLDFYASGSQAFSGGSPFQVLDLDTDLTLHPVTADFRQETTGPRTTKATFVVWNENETQFTGLDRCITCWDQTLLSLYAPAANHFLLANLQTDKGKARIDGVESQLCDVDAVPNDGPLGFDGRDIVSVPAALLGVAAKQIAAPGAGGVIARSGLNLVGMGTQTAVVRYDLAGAGGPPPMNDPPPVGPVGADRVSGTEKGSLLIFSKIEIRWDAAGNVVQDTFVDISNDWPADVEVKMYFVNGDPAP